MHLQVANWPITQHIVFCILGERQNPMDYVHVCSLIAFLALIIVRTNVGVLTALELRCQDMHFHLAVVCVFPYLDTDHLLMQDVNWAKNQTTMIWCIYSSWARLKDEICVCKRDLIPKSLSSLFRQDILTWTVPLQSPTLNRAPCQYLVVLSVEISCPDCWLVLLLRVRKNRLFLQCLMDMEVWMLPFTLPITCTSIWFVRKVLVRIPQRLCARPSNSPTNVLWRKPQER